MKTLCWCSRTMRWCTASARCWRKCRGTTGSNSPTCGRSTLFFTRIRERKCSSWARNWGSGMSGTPPESLDWNLLDYEPHRKLQESGGATQPTVPRGAGAAPSRFRVHGFRMDRFPRRRPFRHRLPAQRARRRATTWWWSATSRRCRTTAIAWVCRRRASIARF